MIPAVDDEHHSGESRFSRIVAASPGGWAKPSTLYRLSPLARSGIWPLEVCATRGTPDRQDRDVLLERGGQDAVLVLRRVLPEAQDLALLTRAYYRTVLDIDDAIHRVAPDLSQPALSRVLRAGGRVLIRGSASASARWRPLVRTLSAVDAVTVGNRILGDFAARYARRVVEIPTTMTPMDAPPAIRADPPVLVWLGLPENLQYLRPLRNVLQTVTSTFRCTLRIVSSEAWSTDGLPVEFVQWSEQAAREALTTATVGLAPLIDDPWTRGKCAFRAIQYGGHGLPCVASPVGVTPDVVLHSQTGYLARFESEWLESLSRLLSNPSHASELGGNALNHIRASYSDTVASAAWQKLLLSL